MDRFLVHICIRGGSWYNCVVLTSSSLHVGGFDRPQSEVRLRLKVTLTDEGFEFANAQTMCIGDALNWKFK